MSINQTDNLHINKQLYQQQNFSQVCLVHQILQNQKQIADSLFKTFCKHSQLIQNKIKTFKFKIQNLQNEASSSYQLIQQQLIQNQNSKLNDDNIDKTIKNMSVHKLRQDNQKEQKKQNLLSKRDCFRLLNNFYSSQRKQFKFNSKMKLDACQRQLQEGRINCISLNLRVPKLYLLTIYQKQLIKFYVQKISQTIRKQFQHKVIEQVNNLLKNNQNEYQQLQNILTSLSQILFQQYSEQNYSLRFKRFIKKKNSGIHNQQSRQNFYLSHFNSYLKHNYSDLNNQSDLKKKEQFNLKFEDFLVKKIYIYSCGFCREKYIDIEYDSSVCNGLFLNFSQFFAHIILDHDKISENNSHLIVGLNNCVKEYKLHHQQKANEHFKNQNMHKKLKEELKKLQKNICHFETHKRQYM